MLDLWTGPIGLADPLPGLHQFTSWKSSTPASWQHGNIGENSTTGSRKCPPGLKINCTNFCLFFRSAVAWHRLETWGGHFLHVEVHWRCLLFWCMNLFQMCDLTNICFNCWLCNKPHSSNIHLWFPKMKSMWGTLATWYLCETTGTIFLISDDPIGFSGSGLTVESTGCSIILLTRSKSSICACPYSSSTLCGSWLTFPWSILFVPTKLALLWTFSFMPSLMPSVFTCGTRCLLFQLFALYVVSSVEGDEVDKNGVVDFFGISLILFPFHKKKYMCSSLYHCAPSDQKAMDVQKEWATSHQILSS